MKRILWLVLVFLFLTPQASALGSSPSQCNLSASSNGGKELNLLQLIKSLISAHKSTPNVSDAYINHPGFPKDISGWIEKSSITIADSNGDGSCV